jgi:hypothetical protein
LYISKFTSFFWLFPVPPAHLWIAGPSRSGKTTRLVEYFSTFHPAEAVSKASVLAFAANSENRSELVTRLIAATRGESPVRSVTPLGFFQDEVILFWPLLIQHLQLRAQFPLLLRPENEQELATRLWRSALDQGVLYVAGVIEQRLVRRILDFQQLAALSGISTAAIRDPLQQGLSDLDDRVKQSIAEALQHWQQWCLKYGLLTYSLVLELYQHTLLPHPLYRQQLTQRFRGVLADDVDEYPAVTRSLFEYFLDQGLPTVLTFNPSGSVRLGLGANPHYLEALAQRCQVEHLSRSHGPCLIASAGQEILETLEDPLLVPALPASIQSIQTISRSQLLRRVADMIRESVQSGQIQPQEIAVIGPGLDAIARYALREILTRAGIGILSLNEQRPLISVPAIRALLTLLALVYPGLGRFIDRDSVAEMLIILLPAIDPIRAGLMTDHCFEPHPDAPRLLPTTAFPRWDRLGYQATQTYAQFLQWIETQQAQYQQRLLLNPVTFLDRAIQHFLWSRGPLPYDQLSAFRELLETAQHYWEVDARLQPKKSNELDSQTVAAFIQLLRAGTVTANPYPVRPWGQQRQAVTVATVFQYRSSRAVHRWQFWLDAGSLRWLTGTDSLYRAEIFLQERLGQPWTAEETFQAQEQRLRRIAVDLLSRAQERVFLCHSDLATNGQEQVGPLLALVNASTPCTQ